MPPALPRRAPRASPHRSSITPRSARIANRIARPSSARSTPHGRVPGYDDDRAHLPAARVLGGGHRLYPLALKLVAGGYVGRADGRCHIDIKRDARGELIAPEN